MDGITPLEDDLIDHLKDWQRTDFKKTKRAFEDLVDHGQHPHSMLIACCDSRVDMLHVFDGKPGDFFVHRNIANLVPHYSQRLGYSGTVAALEYGVTALHVKHIIVAGHSQCGGVKGCHDMCSGQAPELRDRNSTLGQWLEILRPAAEALKPREGVEPTKQLERDGIRLSLANLLSYPFIKERIDAGSLTLQGVWYDIREGEFETLDPVTRRFAEI